MRKVFVQCKVACVVAFAGIELDALSVRACFIVRVANGL